MTAVNVSWICVIILVLLGTSNCATYQDHAVEGKQGEVDYQVDPDVGEALEFLGAVTPSTAVKDVTNAPFIVKLRPNAQRRDEHVALLALQWAKALRINEGRIHSVDRDTMLMQDMDQEGEKVISLLLTHQPDAYEIQWKGVTHRRPADISYAQLRKNMLSKTRQATRTRIKKRMFGLSQQPGKNNRAGKSVKRKRLPKKTEL